MFVKNILVGKRGNVVTIEPTADLTAAVKLLAERRIGGRHPGRQSSHRRHLVGARYCARARRAWTDSAEQTGRSGHDARCKDLLRRRYHRRLDGPNDDGQIPPYAGGGAGKAHRHRVDWRCSQEPRRRNRTRIRSATRLHPPVIRSMDYTHRSGSLPDRDERSVTDISRSPRHVCFTPISRY